MIINFLPEGFGEQYGSTINGNKISCRYLSILSNDIDEAVYFIINDIYPVAEPNFVPK
jgi:hypothetical protein